MPSTHELLVALHARRQAKMLEARCPPQRGKPRGERRREDAFEFARAVIRRG